MRTRVPPRGDALLAACVCAATVVCLYTSPLSAPSGFVRGGDALGVLVAVGMTGPLAWRRRWPLLTLAVVAGFSEVSNLRNYATDPADFLSWFALGSAAFYTSRRVSIVLAVLATGFELYWWLDWDLPNFTASDATWAVAVGVVPVLLGDLLRTHRAHTVAIAERERRLRDLEAAKAVESERLRIARELHDIVGHHLSAIGVHARATALLVHREPDRASVELKQLGVLAATALAETRQSVALLRSGSNDTGPQPRLAEINELAGIVQAEGIDVDVQRTGIPRPLLDSVELCAYRVVQEALTNVAKHAARPARAHVTISFETATLEITVRSHGARAPSGAPDGGYGLAGMRERVALAGGTCYAGAQDQRTWVVQVTIPLGGSD